MAHADLTVVDGGMEFLLLQVTPGFEEEVARSLQRQGLRLIYKAIGKYDLICIRPFADEPKGIGLIPAGELSRIVDYEHLVTFLWNSERTLDLYNRLTFGHEPDPHCFALTLLKVNPVLLESGELTPIENDFRLGFDQLQTALSKTQLSEYLVVGGLGWFNSLILTWDNAPARIAEVLANVGGITEHDEPVYLKTLTIYGLSYEFILPSENGPPKRAWELLDDSTGVRAELLVTCRPERTAELLNAVKERFQAKANLVFGAEDIAAESNLSLGQYFKQLLLFRKDYGSENPLLWSTTTRLRFEPPAVEGTRSSARPREAFASVRALVAGDPAVVMRADGNDAAAKRQDCGELERRFAQVYMRAIQSPLLCDAYLDMLPAVHELAKDTIESTILEGTRREILLYLNLAYQQRSLGTLNSTWNFGNPVPLFYRSGVHRALWAVEGLIDSLLQQSDENWVGFAVFGVLADYLRSHLGMITLPLRTALNPGEWWGVFHEVGHECFWRKVQKPGIDVLLDQIIGPGSAPGEQRDQIARQLLFGQLWEVFSDIFDFEIGFIGNWELYKQTVSDYLVHFFLASRVKEVLHQGYSLPNTPLGELLLGYVSRFLAVYIYRTREPDRTHVAQYYEPFRLEVVDLLRRLLIDVFRDEPSLAEATPEAFLREFEQLLSLNNLERHFLSIGYYHLVLTADGQKFLASMLPRPPEESGIRLSEAAAAQVADGRIVCEPVAYPQVLICNLLSTREGYRSKVATILTLWNIFAARLVSLIEAATGDESGAEE